MTSITQSGHLGVLFLRGVLTFIVSKLSHEEIYLNIYRNEKGVLTFVIHCIYIYIYIYIYMICIQTRYTYRRDIYMTYMHTRYTGDIYVATHPQIYIYIYIYIYLYIYIIRYMIEYISYIKEICDEYL